MEHKPLSFAQNALFNTVGALINCFCLWLTTLVVVRFSNDYANAGIWQLSISVTNIFIAVSAFNLPSYMISDTQDEYTIGQYIGTQLITCVGSVIVCSVYSLVCGYRGELLSCVLAYTVCVCTNSFISFLHAINQRNYRMDYNGISNGLRGILSLLVFALVLRLTRRLFWAVMGMTIVSFVVLFLYDYPKTQQFAPLHPVFCKQNYSLLYKCLPLVVAGASFVAISTVSRQTLQAMCGEEALGQYATVATPVVVVQTLARNVFAPLVRDLALSWHSREVGRIRRILAKFLLWTGVLAGCALVGSRFLGEFLWTLVYGESIRPYCYLLYGVVGCVVLDILCSVCSHLFIIMRRRKTMLLISLISLLTTALSSTPLIRHCSLSGVSYSILLGYIVYLLASVSCLSHVLRVAENQEREVSPRA